MKKFYTTTVLSLLFTALFGQTAQIIDHNNTIINNGDTVTYFSKDINASEHYLEFKIKNTSSATISYKVRQKSISIEGNSSRYFCFAGSCYSPAIDLSSSSLTLKASQTSLLNEFSTHYKPYGYSSGSIVTYPGTSIIAYSVFDKNTPSDSTYFIIKYTVIDATSINENKNNYSIGNIYPNPTSDYFFINYNITNANTAQIEISNLLGSKVLSQNISTMNNKAKVDINKLSSGIYFYYFIIDGNKTEAKKLIVQ